MKTKNSMSFALLGGVALFLALQGCGDDDGGNDRPPVVNPKGGSSGTGNEAGSDAQGGTDGGGTGGTAGTAGTGNTGNTGNTGGGDNQGGTGVGGAPPEPTCDLPERGENGCYNCPARGEQEQWFNRCVDSDCEPFDNDRVTLLNEDGSLPPLP